MILDVKKYGPSTIARVQDSADLKGLLDDPWLASENIIVKLNWVGTELATFTDCQTLRFLFEALDAKVVVTEAYQIGRSMNELDDGLSFTHRDKEVNWRWLMRGGWSWLERNPSWDWFKEGGHWEQIRREDKLFLDEQGFTDLFQDHGVEYINVTEEVWKGRAIDPGVIKEVVESRFTPVFNDRLYGFVPKRLFELRGSTMISLAKVKHYATFTLKNLFGMIPDPIRAWWHGPRNERFDRSVVDINKVHGSLFNVYGICEAIGSTAVPNPKGEFGMSSFRYDVVPGPGVVAFGRQRVSLDAALCAMLGFDFKDASYLDLAEEEFGSYSREVTEEARAEAAEMFTFRPVKT